MKSILILCLLVLTACNGAPGTDSAGESNNQNQTCSFTDKCAKKPQWTVNSSSVNFPKKFSLYINGSSVLSTCLSATAATVSEVHNDRVLISFNYLYIPEEQASLDIKIVDLGAHCDYPNEFYSEKYVEYKVVTTAKGQEITAILKN